MYKKILVPTDGSALSEQASASAISFARLTGAEIVALCVVEPYPPVPAAEGAMMIDPGYETAELEKAAIENVEKVARAAREAGVACTTVTKVALVPHEEIIRTAQEQRCDLVFMASHGRRGLSKLLAGSVTQNVLAHSTIPVMVLRPSPESGLQHAAGNTTAAPA